MKLKFILPALLLASACPLASAQQNSMNDPMTQAMMEVFNQELNANPDNYEVLYRRANEYYKFDQYLRALADVDKAIQKAPAEATDHLYLCHLLRGDIYQMLGKHEEALSDFNEAYKLDPTSFTALYQKANTEYELGQYAQAKIDYNRMRAQSGRSAEALTGLARVAIKENNLGLASEYMNDAVAMMPADSDIYVRRSSVRRQLGNNNGAVEDLLMAISLDNNSKAFRQLVDIADQDYPAVISALSNAISQAPEQGMLLYIRGFIAQAHQHYPQAIADYQKIIDENFYNYAGIYASLGQCHYALCDYQQALDNVNRAIGMGNDADNAEFQLTLAKICRAQGRYDDALRAADRALTADPNLKEASVEKALVLFSLKRYDEASTIFGELVMDNPTEPMNYLYRAWVIGEGLGKTGDAQGFYKRMEAIDIDSDSTKSLAGFPLLFTGKKAEALAWMEKILKNNTDTDGTLNYMGACLYAQANEADKAFDCLEAALSKGYSNLYNLKFNNDARVNIAPIRGQRLEDVLTRYDYVFKE